MDTCVLSQYRVVGTGYATFVLKQPLLFWQKVKNCLSRSRVNKISIYKDQCVNAGLL